MDIKESQFSTAFTTPIRLHKWEIYPNGLVSAPGDFESPLELFVAGVS